MFEGAHGHDQWHFLRNRYKQLVARTDDSKKIALKHLQKMMTTRRTTTYESNQKILQRKGETQILKALDKDKEKVTYLHMPSIFFGLSLTTGSA